MMAMALRCFWHLPSLLYRSSFAVRRGLPQAPTGCPSLLLDGCRQCVRQVLLTRQLATKKGNGFHTVCNPLVCWQNFLSCPLYLVYKYWSDLGRTQLWRSWFASWCCSPWEMLALPLGELGQWVSIITVQAGVNAHSVTNRYILCLSAGLFTH